MDEKARQLARRTSLIYGLVAAVWILTSDRVVQKLFPSADDISNFQTYKGLGFVVVTAWLLYYAMLLSFRRRDRDKARREAQATYFAGPARVLEMIASGVPLAQTLDQLLRLTESEFPEMLSSIHLLEDSQRLRHIAAPSLPAEFTKLVNEIVIGPKVGSCGTAAFLKQPVIVSDIATDPLWESYRDAALKHGLLACWSHPILDTKQNVLGTLALYFRKPASPEVQHRKLIESITHIAAIAIAKHREEQTLHASEQRYRLLTDHAADAFIVHDREGKLVEVNRRACEQLGYSREELLGMRVTDVEKDLDAQALEEVLRQVRPGQVKTIIGQHGRKDGTSFPVETRLGAFEADGQILYHALSRDITERKRAADALEMFRTLVDRVNDSIEVIDPETGRFLDINEKACTDLGYTREDMLSLTVMDVDHSLDAAGFKERKEKLWDTGALLVESTNRRKDGTTFPVEVNMKWVWLDRDYIVAVVRDITERKKNEESLQMMRFSVDRAGDSVFWISRAGRILYANDSACASRGYDREELLGMAIFDLDPDYQPGVWDPHFEDLKQRGSITLETRHCAKDGRVFPVEVNANYVHLGGQEFNFCFLRDITERKKTEAALRESEHQFADLVNNIDGIVWERDVAAVMTTFVSFQAERILGYPVANWTTNSGFWQNHLHPDDREEALVFCRERMQQGAVYDLEYRMIAADGREVWIHDFVSVVMDNGKPVTLRGVMVDVTERKNAEAKIRKREERFRLLIENASDIVTVINAEGIIRFQSPSVTRILGYQPEEMIGRISYDFRHPEDVARFASAVKSAFANPGLPVSVEYRKRHSDGTWRYIQSVVRSIAGEAPDGFLILNSRDISETRKLEEQFRQSQKMEAIGQLAGGVAHDLNNILTVVHMQLDMLKHGDPLTPIQADSVLDIEKASRRAADLTRQLLMFSRRQAAMKHDIDLNAVVTNITKMLQRILGEDVAMHISYAPQPLPVHADSGMLDQILLNLAVNSRDAMPAGGKIVIETSVAEFDEFAVAQKPYARVGRFACLSVSDTGKGIPPEILPRIFEPFFTTKDIGKGTGLGLATVFGIVQQHNGWINAYSEIGKGTVFRMYLPLQKEAEAVVAETTFVAKGGNETILLVEDEQSLRVLVRNVLTRLGYRVLEATTGLTAVEVWKEHRHDIKLLLTDLVMPDGMTGKQLAEVLVHENPNLKVIYTSGYSRDIAGQGFPLQDGVNFLSKPFQAAKLGQTVRNSLDAVV